MATSDAALGVTFILINRSLHAADPRPPTGVGRNGCKGGARMGLGLPPLPQPKSSGRINSDSAVASRQVVAVASDYVFVPHSRASSCLGEVSSKATAIAQFPIAMCPRILRVQLAPANDVSARPTSRNPCPSRYLSLDVRQNRLLKRTVYLYPNDGMCNNQNHMHRRIQLQLRRPHCRPHQGPTSKVRGCRGKLDDAI